MCLLPRFDYEFGLITLINVAFLNFLKKIERETHVSSYFII